MSPDPHPRSATVHSGGSSPASVGARKDSPKSPRRTSLQLPATAPNHPRESTRRRATTAAIRSRSRRAVTSSAPSPRTTSHSRRAGSLSASGSTRSIAADPSARRCTQPSPTSAFRCRLTVDCGSCTTLASSPTPSSSRSSSRSIRTRTGSARAERWA